jgi:hypothetical protein
MSKLALLPVIAVAIAAVLSSILSWAMARHLEITDAQRAAVPRPRSRPYGTSLPDSLIKR